MLNFVFSVDTLYRKILEEKSIGNVSHEDQLYNAISYSVANNHEAHSIVQVLDESEFDDKGTKAWKFMRQRYDRVSKSKIQRVLDSHR